jgi:hypothetical protein
MNDIGSPLTPIPFVINLIPSTPLDKMIGVTKIHVPTVTQHVVSTQPIETNPFKSLFGTPRYNSQSIPSVSSSFSFGMPNMISQLSSSIETTNANSSFGPGGMTPLHAPLSFGGGHIPQMNPTVGGQPPYYSRSNPSINAPRWSTQPRGHFNSHIPSFPHPLSMSILKKCICYEKYPSVLWSSILWETPNLYLLQLGVVFITLIMPPL